MNTTPDAEALATRRRVTVALGILGVLGALIFALSRAAPGKPPGIANSAALRVLVATLMDQQRTTSAGRVRSRCESAVADPCSCVKAAVHEALDASLTDVAASLLAEGKSACAEPLGGQEAELAARSGAPGADAKAREVLKARPGDPYAAYALAHLSWAGNVGPTESWAEAAVTAGRGAPAHLLVGLSALGRGQLETARRAFGRVLESEPADVPALYDIALCDHRLGRYLPAREGYLHVLGMNPRHLDARYNLALLTAAGGFRAEAAHHLAELRKLAPGDPRIQRLEASLAAEAPAAASSSATPKP